MPSHPLPHAQTSHEDLTGSFSLDLQDGPESLARLALRGGIDINRYLPVGISLVYAHGKSTVCMYCLDRQRLEGFALQHSGRLPVVKCTTELQFEQVLPEVAELEIQAFDHTKALEQFVWVAEDPTKL